MYKILLISQVTISILLSLIILIQGKDEGLTATFGTNEGFHSTRRGAEKIIYRTTIVLAFLFLLNALLFVLV